MRIAVCDDEKIALEQTCDTVKRVFDEMRLKYSIDKFLNADNLIAGKYDLVFLDIELKTPGKNGVWAAKIIKRNNPGCIIIFTTNYEEYIDEVIEKYAFRYWSKPIDEYRLRKSVRAILERIQTITVEIYSSRREEELPIRDIMYITPDDRRCKIVTISEEYITAKPYKEIREQLTAGNFCDCHGSYCVNLNFVERYTKTEVRLRYDTKRVSVHMSRRKYASFKEQIFIMGEKRE